MDKEKICKIGPYTLAADWSKKPNPTPTKYLTMLVMALVLTSFLARTISRILTDATTQHFIDAATLGTLIVAFMVSICILYREAAILTITKE